MCSCFYLTRTHERTREEPLKVASFLKFGEILSKKCYVKIECKFPIFGMYVFKGREGVKGSEAVPQKWSPHSRVKT